MSALTDFLAPLYVELATAGHLNGTSARRLIALCEAQERLQAATDGAYGALCLDQALGTEETGQSVVAHSKAVGTLRAALAEKEKD